jgi:hypothetical protein
MGASTRQVEVLQESPWFATRLSALLAQNGYAVAPFYSVGNICRESDRPPPTAPVFHLSPTAELRSNDIVADLRGVRGFAGPVIVLDRVRRADGATRFLPRDAPPARIAALVRRLLEPGQ